jgi:hypothetical protein
VDGGNGDEDVSDGWFAGTYSQKPIFPEDAILLANYLVENFSLEVVVPLAFVIGV